MLITTKLQSNQTAPTSTTDDKIDGTIEPCHEMTTGHKSSTPELPSKQSLAAAGELLRALAAPLRISIVMLLLEEARCVHELVESLDVAQPLVSQHLRVLKSAGVVTSERSGREVMYRLADEHLSHIVIDAVAHVEEEL